MSEFKNKSITTKGLELLSKGLSGDKLEFTRIEMGGGNFTGDIGEPEGLVDVKQNLPITKISRKGSQVTLSTALKIEDITVDFDWTEIGVYAKGNDGVEILYLYGHTYNSSFISKDSLNEKLINITLMVSNVAEVTALIDDSLVYLTAEALQQHEEDIHTHTDIREALEEVKDSLSTLDISWEGITGKPQQFPPTQHNHSWGEIPDRPTSLPASGGNADTIGGLDMYKLGTLAASGLGHGTAHPMYVKHNVFGDGRFVPCIDGHEIRVNYATSSDVSWNCSVVQNRDLCVEVDSLKQSVVNGKQSVVNAINDKIGYNTGLTTNHTHDDYAWWIRDKMISIPNGSQSKNVALKFFDRTIIEMQGSNDIIKYGKVIYGNDIEEPVGDGQVLPFSLYKFIMVSGSDTTLSQLHGSYNIIKSNYTARTNVWFIEMTGDCSIGIKYYGQHFGFIKESAFRNLLNQ